MRKHIKYLKKEKGMTLVELLAVLVILAIVAIIAIPMIGNIISKSDAKADVNEALNIINAAKFAYMDGVDKDSYEPTDLEKYLDSTTSTSFTVTKTEDTKENTVTWTISGHPANDIEGIDGTEISLKNWLESNN